MNRFSATGAVVLSAFVVACSPGAPRRDDPSVVEVAPAPQAPPPMADNGALPRQASDDWKVYAKPEDVVRLSRIDGAWAEALRRARADGHEADLDALGLLAKPGGGLEPPYPTPGAYRCRMILFGGTAPQPVYAASDYTKCQVELTPGGDLVLRSLEGAARFQGKLYPERATELVYLGSVGQGASAAPDYGQTSGRDEIGRFERIGDDHYRLALIPRVADSGLELIEVVK